MSTRSRPLAEIWSSSSSARLPGPLLEGADGARGEGPRHQLAVAGVGGRVHGQHRRWVDRPARAVVVDRGEQATQRPGQLAVPAGHAEVVAAEDLGAGRVVDGREHDPVPRDRPALPQLLVRREGVLAQHRVQLETSHEVTPLRGALDHRATEAEGQGPGDPGTRRLCGAALRTHAQGPPATSRRRTGRGSGGRRRCAGGGRRGAPRGPAR